MKVQILFHSINASTAEGIPRVNQKSTNRTKDQKVLGWWKHGPLIHKLITDSCFRWSTKFICRKYEFWTCREWIYCRTQSDKVTKREWSVKRLKTATGMAAPSVFVRVLIDSVIRFMNGYLVKSGH